MKSANCLVYLVVVILVTVDAGQKKSSPCKTKSDGFLPDPDKCSVYYDCSATRDYDRKKECRDPQLFNPDTQRCEHYTMVKCGTRKEPFSLCDYEYYSACWGSSCGAPCWVYNPSCKGLTDGLNVWQNRLRSSYFVVCKNGRTVYKDQCKGGLIYDQEKGCVRHGC